MKLIKNTYKQDKNFKNKEFSKGEFLTEDDLAIIKSRTTTYNVFDSEYENGYWGEEYEDYTNVPEYNTHELQYNADETFSIGNNISGGI